jgi:hypothetical protein
MQVDRLQELETNHGFEVRTEILQALTQLLQQETRAGDFLGTLIDDRLLVLLPHTSGEVGMLLARRLLDSARRIEFDLGGRTMRITLSIGLSHNRHKDAKSFGTLVHVSEEGARVADSAGGNRCVETELYTLFERKGSAPAPEPRAAVEAPAEPAPELRRRKPAASEAPPPPAPVPEPVSQQSFLERWVRGPKDDALRRRLEKLVESEGSLEAAVAKMADEILGTPPKPGGDPGNLGGEKEGEYLREIDILRRRISKLSQSLGMTEEALRRVKDGKALDGGLSSIYRDVQGVGDQDSHAEIKRELMANIFAANMDLQKKGTD